ncbi:MAG: SufE family protein [Gemmatimonadales bacterium]
MVFDTLINRFRATDRNTRLETLLDYSRKLPELPGELRASSDLEAHRVTECQTPVFLWVGVTGGAVTIFAEVPRESPTVRGFVALLIARINGATPADVAAIPDDLLDQLALGETLGMMRTQGLTAILGRIKRSVAMATTES